MALPLLIAVLKKFAVDPRYPIRVVVDDSPTPRYGKHVEGRWCASQSDARSGRWRMDVRAQLGIDVLLSDSSTMGVVALPLRSLLYVRLIDLPLLADKYNWKFRTKHELAVEL